FKADKKLYKLDLDKILYLQAFGDYVRIVTAEKSYLTKDRLSNIEEKLPEQDFLKIHRSYIVGLRAVQYIEGNQAKVGEALIPISLTYRDLLIERIKE
ncbi:MAG: LytTR family DNA-binding domain-containing protein, partial [Bacteroidota bacterium]